MNSLFFYIHRTSHRKGFAMHSMIYLHIQTLFLTNRFTSFFFWLNSSSHSPLGRPHKRTQGENWHLVGNNLHDQKPKLSNCASCISSLLQPTLTFILSSLVVPPFDRLTHSSPLISHSSLLFLCAVSGNVGYLRDCFSTCLCHSAVAVCLSPDKTQQKGLWCPTMMWG